jgi:tRNA-specific 2-thiouridylase
MSSKSLKPKIVVGMSGGIDSSAAIFLLQKQGFQPIGLTLKLPTWQHTDNNLLGKNKKNNKDKKNTKKKKNNQNNLSDSDLINQPIKIAQSICKTLNVPHYTWDVKQGFIDIVVQYFINETKHQRTPNPCLICNRYFKLQKLLEWAKNHQINYVATGHYAQIKYNTRNRKYELWQSKDKKKDQSYYLALLNQQQLKHLIFPLGNYYKESIYQLAQKQNWLIFQRIKESQDFCFIKNKDLKDFLKTKLLLPSGPILDKNDPKQQVLGQHHGLPLYTLGQREGLGLANGPFYVCGFDFKNNALIVTHNKRDLFKKEILISPYTFISGEKLKHSALAKVKLRSSQTRHLAKMIPLKKSKNIKSNQIIKLIFNKPVFCPTPGQFAVWYQDNKCLGGGKILETN